MASGYANQVFHAEIFPLPTNCDVVSQPVNATKNNNARHRVAPKDSYILFTL